MSQRWVLCGFIYGVDIQIQSFWHELFNIGDIALSFDAPSHGTLIVLKNIDHPKIGILLADQLEEMMNPSKVWFQKGSTPEHIKFTEDILRKGVLHEAAVVV
jgi:hypothetical protein